MQKILIVDDDKDLCFLLNRFLTRKGYDVTVKYAGLEAIAYILKEQNRILLSATSAWAI
jgi:two-component system response regulator HydG